MRWLFLTLPLFGAACADASAGSGRNVSPDRPATVLIGQSWLGLWRDGRVVRSRAVNGWQFGAARLSSDGLRIEVAANRTNASSESDIVLKFDAGTLAPLGRSVDRVLSRSIVRTPIGVDLGVPDDTAEVVRTSPSVVRQFKHGDRVIRSPIGDVVVVFAPGRQTNDAWVGTASLRGSVRQLTTPGLSIDDGSQRENGAAKSVACLLPRGEGIIFTYIGAPADRESEFQAFAPGARPVAMNTPYVVSCLAAPATQ